jgi:hypothetical protein
MVVVTRALGVALFVFLGGGVPAQSQFYTGNELYPLCEQSRRVVYGYVAGAADHAMHSLEALLIFQMDTPFVIDRPGWKATKERILGSYSPRVTVGQLGDVLCNYLRDAPQERHESAAALFSRAMSRAWPCKPSR